MTTIGERPSTFSELVQSDAIGLSRPILSKYLTELLSEGSIERKIMGKRIEYQITGEGREAERLRRELYAAVFHLVQHLIVDRDGSKAIRVLAKTATDDPVLFERLMELLKDLMLFSTSNETLRWMREHPRNQWEQILKKELKGVPRPLTLGDSKAQVLESLQFTLKMMRTVVASSKARES